MKNPILFFKQALFLFLLTSCIYACTKQADQEVETTPEVLQEGVYSLEDFQTLVDQDVYPINQLSEAAIEHFKAGLIFQDDMGLKGTDSEMIDKELDMAGKKALFELLIGGEVIFIDDISEIETAARARRDSRKLGYAWRHHTPIVCPPESHPNDCCKWSANLECIIPWTIGGGN